MGDIDILNYALTLEYLEAAFYKEALAKGALSGATKKYATVVAADEAAHVKALKGALGSKAVKTPEVRLPGHDRQPGHVPEDGHGARGHGCRGLQGPGAADQGDADPRGGALDPHGRGASRLVDPRHPRRLRPHRCRSTSRCRWHRCWPPSARPASSSTRQRPGAWRRSSMARTDPQRALSGPPPRGPEGARPARRRRSRWRWWRRRCTRRVTSSSGDAGTAGSTTAGRREPRRRLEALLAPRQSTALRRASVTIDGDSRWAQVLRPVRAYRTPGGKASRSSSRPPPSTPTRSCSPLRQSATHPARSGRRCACRSCPTTPPGGSTETRSVPTTW